jgi:hypothetical protein
VKDYSNGEWFKRVDQRLAGLDEKPLAEYRQVFGELDWYHSRLRGSHLKAAESLWAAAVAYLVLDVTAGDELRREAARYLHVSDRNQNP